MAHHHKQHEEEPGFIPDGPITKQEAGRQARIGAKLQGGTWYVTRKGQRYGYTEASAYNTRRHGKVVESIRAMRYRPGANTSS